MSDYLSLEEAAAKLGIPTDRLVDMRSQGQVRGFRDGASWKFPQNEIDRIADELADAGEGFDAGEGSGILADDSGSGLSGGSGLVIGGDDTPVEGGSGSDLGIGNETLKPGSGSDVNLVTAEGDEGSDVALVADGDDALAGGQDTMAGDEDALASVSEEDLLAGSDDATDPSADDLPSGLEVGELMEIDSAELQLEDPAITHDSAMIDVAIEPKEGSTGPVAKRPVVDEQESSEDSDLSLSASLLDEEDSDDLVLGGDDDSSGMNVLGSDLDLSSEDASAGKASSLELLDELDAPASESGSLMGSGADVLSELDLLGEEQGGSGLISGDSGGLLGGSSGVGDASSGSDDDALADDDDLVISDGDDDLVIDSHGSDISIAGDSGINLMSPSDSGLSLESEPLDLAGSSISALDLGAELAEEGSGIGSGSGVGAAASGSDVDFQADEEFQLSPSGIGLEAELDSGSQVIEVEDSEAIGEAVEFDDAGFGDAPGGDVFVPEAVPESTAIGGAVAFDEEGEPGGMAVAGAAPVTGTVGYEIPFTTLQCVSLAMIMCVMALCGMLMTDLVRNMWTYTEPAAPVSSLTGFLIDLMGW